MEVIFKERQLIFTWDELNSNFTDEKGELLAILFSVMAYPENEEKQFLYKLGLRAENLDKFHPSGPMPLCSSPIHFVRVEIV